MRDGQSELIGESLLDLSDFTPIQNLEDKIKNLRLSGPLLAKFIDVLDV